MSYPSTPGSKTTGPSADSARKVAGVADILRLKVMALLKREHLTADEVAEQLGETVLSIRPRVSELKRMGMVIATGARRFNASGHSATVWRATNP